MEPQEQVEPPMVLLEQLELQEALMVHQEQLELQEALMVHQEQLELQEMLMVVDQELMEILEQQELLELPMDNQESPHHIAHHMANQDRQEVLMEPETPHMDNQPHLAQDKPDKAEVEQDQATLSKQRNID